MRAPKGQIGTVTQVQKGILMHVYYDREGRSWWAYYMDEAGNQLGNGWFGFTRDEVLVHRPPTPELPDTPEEDV